MFRLIPIRRTSEYVEADVVSDKLRNRHRVLNHLDRAAGTLAALDIAPESQTFPNPALIELHVTDACELNCVFCTYDDRISEAFPYASLGRVALLKPRAVVLVGGGEPTLYREGRYRFKDVVMRLRELLPQAQMGLASNGAIYPGPEASGQLSWVRVSLDAASAHTHETTKRDPRSSFSRRIENIISYLEANVPHVGVGFIYHRQNLHEVALFLSLIYERIAGFPQSVRERVNIQFRPTCGIQSCECPSSNYKAEAGRLMTPDLTKEWQIERARQLSLVCDHMAADPDFGEFVRRQTNFLSPEVHNPVPKVGPFNHCYLSLVRMLIRANGNLYPCVMKASQGLRPLANILSDAPEKLCAGVRSYYNLESGWCKGQAECCNIDGVKNIYLQEALEHPHPSGPPAGHAEADPFF